MKRLVTAVCLLFSILCLPSPGAELTDLGQGLGYLRIHSLAADDVVLRKSVSTPAALVLDLRYVTADAASTDALKTIVVSRPPGAQLFVLVSPATPPAVAAALAAFPALVLGAPGSVPAPKVIVQTDAAADRRAFDALESGTELSKLITGRIEKDRFDEATLVQEFKSGNHDAEPPASPDPTAPKAGVTPAKESPPAAPVDRVLQRAVHLHRALQALKR
jgi:hypothetical protein